eukprot:10722536-Prorocentrum_lima.AAC.1
MWRPFCSPRWAGRAGPASAGLGGLPVNILHAAVAVDLEATGHLLRVVEAILSADLHIDVGYHAVHVRVAVHVPGCVHS